MKKYKWLIIGLTLFIAVCAIGAFGIWKMKDSISYTSNVIRVVKNDYIDMKIGTLQGETTINEFTVVESGRCKFPIQVLVGSGKVNLVVEYNGKKVWRQKIGKKYDWIVGGKCDKGDYKIMLSAPKKATNIRIKIKNPA